MKQFLTILFISISSLVNAQSVMSLYNMRHIPQSVYANPSFTPLARVNISIPGLGSNYLQAGKSNFVTKNIATQNQNGDLMLNVDKFMNGLENNNSVYTSASIEALHLGMAVKKNYFFLAINDRISGEFEFPKEIAVLISEVLQERVVSNGYTIENTKVQYTHIREYSFGWSRSINKKLNIGARGKLLAGIANIRTNYSKAMINNLNSINDLSAKFSIDMQTSGLPYYQQDFSQNTLKKITNHSDYGYALDLGFEYKITPKVKVAASVIDLMGTIKWNKNVLNYVANDVGVDFNTIDWENVLSTSDENAFTGIYDSIIANVEPEKSNTAYQTTTPTQVLASFTYYLTPKIEATLITQGIFSQNEFEPRIRIGIQGRVKRFLNYMVSYSIIDSQKRLDNLGIGFALNFGPLQFHALTDNIFDPILYSDSFNPSLRLGLNLTINRDYK